MQLQTLGIGMPTRPSNLPSQLGNRQQQSVQSDGAIVTTNGEFPPNNGLRDELYKNRSSRRTDSQ